MALPSSVDVKQEIKQNKNSHVGIVVHINDQILSCLMYQSISLESAKQKRDNPQRKAELYIYFQADQEMIDTMSQKLQESLEVALKYPELHKTCKENLSKLDTFYVNYIMKFDYKNSDLSQAEMIGSGSYANVYKGIMKDSGKEVAVKIAKDVVNMSNVTDVLTEDKIMR